MSRPSAIVTARVRPDEGEPYVVSATTRDALTWERTTNGASMAQLGVGVGAQALYKLTWIAARRLGLYAGTLAEFEASCDLEVVPDDDDDDDEGSGLDPTRPAP